MNNTPVISLLVPTFNRPSPLESLLASLEKEINRLPTGSVEVVVGDNGSERPTNDVLECFQNRLPMRVRRWDRNRGFVANHDDLLDRANGDVMAWISDDCLVLPGGLRRLLENIRNHPECAAFLSSEASLQSKKVMVRSLSEWDQVLLPSLRAAEGVGAILFWSGGKFFRRAHYPRQLCAKLNWKGPNSSGIMVLVQNVLLKHPVHYANDAYFVLDNLSDWSFLGPTVDERYHKACREYFRALHDAAGETLSPEQLEHRRAPQKRLEHFVFYCNEIMNGQVGDPKDRLNLLQGLLSRETDERLVGIPDPAMEQLLNNLVELIEAQRS